MTLTLIQACTKNLVAIGNLWAKHWQTNCCELQQQSIHTHSQPSAGGQHSRMANNGIVLPHQIGYQSDHASRVQESCLHSRVEWLYHEWLVSAVYMLHFLFHHGKADGEADVLSQVSSIGSASSTVAGFFLLPLISNSL
jgi:hypothetical protein